MVGMNWDKWPDHKMHRDVRRRRLVKEHAPMRLRYIAMKRNNILPPEIQVSSPIHLHLLWRCY